MQILLSQDEPSDVTTVILVVHSQRIIGPFIAYFHDIRSCFSRHQNVNSSLAKLY